MTANAAAPHAHTWQASLTLSDGDDGYDLATIRMWCSECLIPMLWRARGTDAKLTCRPMAVKEGEP